MKKKNLVEFGIRGDGGVGVGGGVGGGVRVQRLGWLVGGLGARQPKRVGRIRPDGVQRLGWLVGGLGARQPGFEALKKRIWLNSGRDRGGRGRGNQGSRDWAGRPETGLAGLGARQPKRAGRIRPFNTKFFFFHDSKLSGRIRPARFG